MNEILCTRRNKTDYERTVHIHVEKSKSELPYINDSDHCKLVLLRKGSLSLLEKNSDTETSLSAPALLFLNNRDVVEITSSSRFDATILYFLPSVICDDFTYERIYAKEFENKYGTSIYQDYVCIRDFFFHETKGLYSLPLTDDSLLKLTDLIANMNQNLIEQSDDYWPCRSRSFFMEILFFLQFCHTQKSEDNKQEFVALVKEYLNKHIDEAISLSDITRAFHTNRNALNQAFKEVTGETCLSYLTTLRMDLAKIWLRETEIPISEIARRLSYPDQNYFARIFKKECGVSPSTYRWS